MIKKLFLGALLLCGGTFAFIWGAAPKGKTNSSNIQTLGAGSYSAKVKALVCSGCGPLIEKTMHAFPGIESSAVDSGKSTVHFTVKKGATVKLADLQKSLQESAGRMGMGADYTLHLIKK